VGKISLCGHSEGQLRARTNLMLESEKEEEKALFLGTHEPLFFSPPHRPQGCPTPMRPCIKAGPISSRSKATFMEQSG